MLTATVLEPASETVMAVASEGAILSATTIAHYLGIVLLAVVLTSARALPLPGTPSGCRRCGAAA